MLLVLVDWEGILMCKLTCGGVFNSIERLATVFEGLGSTMVTLMDTVRSLLHLCKSAFINAFDKFLLHLSVRVLMQNLIIREEIFFTSYRFLYWVDCFTRLVICCGVVHR